MTPRSIHPFDTDAPLVAQLSERGLEFDQQLQRALQVSASIPNLYPEDTGFPDSYLTLALYRLNSILTRIVTLDETRYNLFHDYRLAPSCPIEDVVPGRKLCRVLDKAATLLKSRNTIGVGDFLRAIVTISLDERPMPADGFKNMVRHDTFSVETLLWGMGYTAWTPVSDAPEVRNILEALDGREPINDFQYLMTLENNRIVFRPTSVLDTYRIKTPEGVSNPKLALLTHFRDQYTGIRTSEILKLEDLINNRRTKEEELQRFFEQHPEFFRMWDYRDVYPHVYLTREDDGPLIPDFVIVDPDLQRAMVLDLKLPGVKLAVNKPNRSRFTSAVEDAIAQLFEYRDWFEHRDNRAKLKERFGMEIFRPRLGVIIGSSQDFRSAFERQKVVSRYPDIEVVTYDDIVKYAQRRMLLIRKA
jgi:Domain of unknown function (DUF4263)